MKYGLMILAVLVFAAFTVVAQEGQEATTGLQIETAKLGTDVQDRELVGDTTAFNLNDRVYLWLKVVGGPADSLVVAWKTGDLEYTTRLNIGGSPWRTWAYKTAAVAGNWTVTVSDASGTVLKELSFVVNKPDM